MAARGSGRAPARSSTVLRRPASSRGPAEPTRSRPGSPERATDIAQVACPYGLGVASVMGLAAARAQSCPTYRGALRRLAAL
eukprot:1515165-Pyramimonas_sp.AAC.1